jgi:hypothetical protein
MIDKDYKPSLIEVNQAPSFGGDTPLDSSIKHALIKDSFSILGFVRNRYGLVPKHRLVEERDRAEQEHEGMFTDIFTAQDKRYYERFLDGA